MGIIVQAEREGCWIEFLLMEDEKMFEEEIKNRREEIFSQPNNEAALADIQNILNEYSKEKEEAEMGAEERK